MRQPPHTHTHTFQHWHLSRREVNRRKKRICFDFDQAEAIFGISSVTCTTNIETEGGPRQRIAANNMEKGGLHRENGREHSTWEQRGRAVMRSVQENVKGHRWRVSAEAPVNYIHPGLSHQYLCALRTMATCPLLHFQKVVCWDVLQTRILKDHLIQYLFLDKWALNISVYLSCRMSVPNGLRKTVVWTRSRS